MTERMVTLVLCLLLAGGLVSCNRTGAQLPPLAYSDRLDKWDVLDICYTFKDFYGKGRSLSLGYLTKVNIRDLEAVSREVDDVWDGLQSEVERFRATRAVIIPRSSRVGGISTPFVFEVSDDGNWTRTRRPEGSTRQ